MQLKSLPGWYFWYQFGTASGHISLVESFLPVLIPLLTPGGAGLHARPQATYQTLVECSNRQIRKVTIRKEVRKEMNSLLTAKYDAWK
jgi:hypothetical protein